MICGFVYVSEFVFIGRQSLHQDLNDAVAEKDELKRQIQEYVIEIKRCQELLSAKVGQTLLENVA